MSALTVEIVGPDRLMWSGTATSVTAPTVEGQIGLRPGHEPILSVLASGEVIVRALNGEDQTIKVKGGFVSFDHNFITIVADEVDSHATADVIK